jgi:alkane 1-monooxygenase
MERIVAAGRLWTRHLLSLVFPLLTLVFVATGPHPAWQSLPGLAMVIAVVFLDGRTRPVRDQAPPDAPRWPFTALVCALAVVQLTTVALLIRMVAIGGFSIDLILVGWFVGNNSGWGTLVVAHELIHRRSRALKWLGRALLCTVLYDHFFVEHLRGHHARVGTSDDAATARFGEGYTAFFLRTVPAQFRSAWRLDRTRVIQGLVTEAALLAVITVAAGPIALVVFLWQAYNAITLLETVNYFEHWGLTRAGERPGPQDAWDTDSWFTLYSLVGLSRHADHHAHAARAYQQLRHVDVSPKLPRGYYAMVALAQLRNRKFQELMTDELRRRRLGPFAPA